MTTNPTFLTIPKKTKNFPAWFDLKPKINSKFKLATYKKRDVFWCHLGENIGNVEDGKGEFFSRPVAILKVFNKEFCFVVPLSSKIINTMFSLNLIINLNQL